MCKTTQSQLHFPSDNFHKSVPVLKLGKVICRKDDMESHIVFALMALALIMVSATPVPPDSNWRQGPVAAVAMEEPRVVGVSQVADKRADGDPSHAGGGFMSLPPMYTSPLFGGKLPFEYISGPYRSNSVYGQPFTGGPFGGLGVPLSEGPLGGIMSVPLLYLMG